MTADAPPDPALLSEAADWLIALRYGEMSERDTAAFARWRQQSPAHQQAWARAETMLGTFAQLPPQIGPRALRSLPRPGRRTGLGLLGAMLLAPPAGWLAWRQLSWHTWMADARTAIGEQRTLQLADGSQLTLNTASAVDLRFNRDERRIRLLAGEILVLTQADPAPQHRPFLVQTPQGTARALGTRFSVRRLDDDTTRVAVFAHAVEVQTVGGASRRLRDGETVDFSAAGTGAVAAVEANAAAWTQGMLVAKNMRLADVLAELARYRAGALRCDPAVANLRLSGALSLRNTEASLATLARSLPLRIERRGADQTMVVPR